MFEIFLFGNEKFDDSEAFFLCGKECAGEIFQPGINAQGVIGFMEGGVICFLVFFDHLGEGKIGGSAKFFRKGFFAEGPGQPAVAVGKGVDGEKVKMGKGGVGDRAKRVLVLPVLSDESFHLGANAGGRRGFIMNSRLVYRPGYNPHRFLVRAVFAN